MQLLKLLTCALAIISVFPIKSIPSIQAVNVGKSYRRAVTTRAFNTDEIQTSVRQCPLEPPTLSFVNGTCHNLEMPNFGVSSDIYARLAANTYRDGLGAIRNDLPSPRLLSNLFCSEDPVPALNERDASSLLIYFGQFVDHDLVLVNEPENEEFQEEAFIQLPETDTVAIDPDFIRSDFVASAENIRDYLNVNTAWLDLSLVYGDTEELGRRLRTFIRGELKVRFVDGIDILPRDPESPPEMPLFLCGDRRCTEHVILSGLHTLFVREHNRLALNLLAQKPTATDEEIFQQARIRNILQYQSIVWDFYLPYLFGRRNFEKVMGPYRGVNRRFNPIATLLFVSAAYRYGHSAIGPNLQFKTPDLTQSSSRPSIPLQEAFFRIDLIENAPQVMDEVLLAHTTIVHPLLDAKVVDGLRNFLFQNTAEDGRGMDLIARNIQRGRDHGLGSFNQYRVIHRLPPIECETNNQLSCFNQLTSNQTAAVLLNQVYRQFDNADIWLAGMIEDRFEDSQLGETFTQIVLDQFDRYRHGDRIWFEALAPQFPDIQFPFRLHTLLQRNSRSFEYPQGGGTGVESAFMTQAVYMVWRTPLLFQVEWIIPVRLEGLVRQFTITLNGVQRIVPGNQLWFLEDQRPNTPAVQRRVQLIGPIRVVVDAQLFDRQVERIGARTFV